MKNKFIFVLLSFFIIVAITFFVCYSFFKYPLKYKNIIVKECYNNGLSTALVSSLIYSESKFKKDAISSVGAMGLMQLMPKTAMEVANKININNFNFNMLLIPEINIKIGCYYLKQMFLTFNGEKEAICAYNAGPNNVKIWLQNSEYSKDGLSLNKIPFKETKKYYYKIIKIKPYYYKKF